MVKNMLGEYGGEYAYIFIMTLLLTPFNCRLRWHTISSFTVVRPKVCINVGQTKSLAQGKCTSLKGSESLSVLEKESTIEVSPQCFSANVL